jgi:CBS-domain-containing membrane protein
VFDYVPGKADWLARGLPIEGEKAGVWRGGGGAGWGGPHDVATCGLDDALADVRERIESSPYGFALVLAAGGTILGRVRRSALGDDPSARAESVMEPGPSTVRADIECEQLRKRLDKRELRTAVVTTPEGRLMGVVRRSDLGD